MRNLFTRYSDCLLAQVLQSVACNALHPIEQRCARWLLTLQDRLDTDTLPITQEMLAERLGVQRTYLTRVLKMLQQQGLIAVGRGRITIRDRADMERASCECHAVVKRHFEEVLGAVYSPKRRPPGGLARQRGAGGASCRLRAARRSGGTRVRPNAASPTGRPAPAGVPMTSCAPRSRRSDSGCSRRIGDPAASCSTSAPAC